MLATLGLALSLAPVAEASDAVAPYRGSWDDLPVDDADLLDLQQMLDAKWTYFLNEMDEYNRGRDSSRNDEMVAMMSLVFAPEFEFRAFKSDGSEFGEVQGTYTPETWIQANDVEETFGTGALHRGLYVPNYAHVLSVVELGRKVTLEGYHEHDFTGGDVRFALGAARQLAFETVTFEKSEGVWRITDYVETLYNVSELNPPSAPGSRSTVPGGR